MSNQVTYDFYILTICMLIGGSLFGQRALINEAKEVLSNDITDSIKTDNYRNLAEAYRFIDVDSALYYNEITYDLAKKNNLARLQNKSLTNKGLFLYDKGNYSKAINSLKQSLVMSTVRNDSSLTAITIHLIGNVYLGIKEYEKAVEQYQLALEYFYQQDAKNHILGSLNSLGAVNLNLKKYDKALEYFEKVRTNAIENKDSLYMAIAISNIGEVYLNQGKIDASITLSKNVNDLIEVGDYPLLIVSNFINIANGYYLQKNYTEALVAGKKGLALCEKYQLNKHKIDIYEILARTFLSLKKISASINYTQKGMSFVKRNNIRGGELRFYKLFSEAYEATNQLQAALEMERKYIQLKDSLNQLQVEEKIANLEFTYGIKQKEAENDLLKEEKKNQALTIQQRTYTIIVISLSLLLLGIILIQMYLARNKSRKLNKQLKAQANELKQNNQFKDRLFGNIAHELRTPLTLITGQLNLILEKSQASIDIRQKIQLAKGSSLSLLDLTNQLLDLTKSKIGLVKISLYSFQLLDLLNYLLLQFEPLAKRKGIELQFIEVNKATIDLIADTEKILTILKNLLTNAIKYNKTGGVIKLYYEDLGENLRITVEDTGQGIPKKDLPLIFDRYYQSQQTQSLEGGIGVGLAICKEYIQLLKGTIKVESNLGEGSAFTIQFPKSQATTTKEIPAYAFPVYPTLTLPVLPEITSTTEQIEEYILVVEDNLELSHYMYDLLKEEYEVYFAQNGKEALQQISIQAPVVIITDWMMPIMDGEALIKHLKNSENLATIPVLMLTARTDIKEQLSLLRIGVDDYLTKPFDSEVLKAHLNHLIEQGRYNRTINREEELLDSLDIKLLAFNKREQNFLEQIEQTVIENLSNFDLTIEKISTLVNLSERHLSRKIKQLTKLTASQYVNEIRFREAKRMLIDRQYTSVKAVVYSVGFKSEKVFSRNFKKRFGKYPKDFLS